MISVNIGRLFSDEPQENLNAVFDNDADHECSSVL
jgi:hypothetical protein